MSIWTSLYSLPFRYSALGMDSNNMVVFRMCAVDAALYKLRKIPDALTLLSWKSLHETIFLISCETSLRIVDESVRKYASHYHQDILDSLSRPSLSCKLLEGSRELARDGTTVLNYWCTSSRTRGRDTVWASSFCFSVLSVISKAFRSRSSVCQSSRARPAPLAASRGPAARAALSQILRTALDYA